MLHEINNLFISRNIGFQGKETIHEKIKDLNCTAEKSTLINGNKIVSKFDEVKEGDWFGSDYSKTKIES